MKAAKITAKLRDAVPVCLYEDGYEMGRYKNIELPDSIKELEIRDFGFDIDAAGWISFHLYFDKGILPEELPAPRLPKHRKAKAEKQPGHDTWSEPATEKNAPEHPGKPSDDVAAYLPAIEDKDEVPAPEEFAQRFNVPGKKRGALARAIGEILACEAKFLNPPSYAYQIGTLTLDREGILHGKLPFGLLTALAKRGFVPAE